ncbi:MAG: hypothetical protein D6814_07760 [Calditrichaeota bacterium]|nr:MAG: hypothetical protein D6814_07760 [Calditrichota bacterium]
MRCHEIRNVLQDYLDNDIPYSVKQVIDEHIVECMHCREYLESYRKLSAILQLRSVPDPPAAYWKSTWKKIKKRLPARNYPLASVRSTSVRAASQLSWRMFFRPRLALVFFGLVAFMALSAYWMSSVIAHRPDTVSMQDAEYVLTYDDNTQQEILVRQFYPSEFQPDFAFAAYSKAAIGGFDPVSKGMGFVNAEATSK